MVSTAPTCGLSKGGRILGTVDTETGQYVLSSDADTGVSVPVVNDQLFRDMTALARHETTDTLRFVPRTSIDMQCAVPVYYDTRFTDTFHQALSSSEFRGFYARSLKDLLSDDLIEIGKGHGSPSQDKRVGEIPYIKVSDLRAGLVNINPTNRVPLAVARDFWRAESSNLRPFDLLSPERTSKNIGDFCVLMPGQEQVVLTKEIIVMRPGVKACFDSFFLLWAMTLSIVRNQWKRFIFMQTNREDVGQRYLDIEIPITDDPALATSTSKAFRSYFLAIADARMKLQEYLGSNKEHHFFVAGAVVRDQSELVSSIDSNLPEAASLNY